MATLVLTVVGGAIGGPVGAMLGASIGGAVDRATLFRPRRREGPRLTDLAAQTSSYGTSIPHLFGTMRVAGTVIWSTDLIEHRARDGGGKRGPETVSYTYSASFAVLLSARPVLGVRRVWADGKLVRGAAGDWKIPARFRLHAGGEDQVPDPLIASAEGSGLAPAHRGMAYAVFEDLALVGFGNRIPALTFEVEADLAAVSCGAIVETVSDGRIDGAGATLRLGGFAAHGDSLRTVVDGLAEASGAWLAADGPRLRLIGGDGPATELADVGVGLRAPGRRGVRAIAPADTAPRSVAIAHYDPARDYQAGLQRAARPGAGRRHVQIDLAAALDAGAAKTLAAAVLARGEAGRERRTLTLDWRALGLEPGARVTVAGEAGRWRIAGWTFETMVLSLELARTARAALAVPATPGRPVTQPDAPTGSTLLHAFEIPPFDDSVLSAPRLTIAAAGSGAGWRRAALQVSLDGGGSWTATGASAAPAVIGSVAVAPGPGLAALADRTNNVEVLLATPFRALADADDSALAAGANLALVGDELVQFGRAVQVGPARWRLSRLWRGRRGSEWAIGGAGVGDRFVLLDPDTLATIDLPAAVLGGTVSVMAVGPGDGDEPPMALAALSGASVLPPAPAHLRVAYAPDGAVLLRWVRRSRAGWRWIDGADAPLAEEAEGYQVTAFAGATPTYAAFVDTPACTLPAIVRSHGAPRVEVRQRGLFGVSRPAGLALSPL